MRTIRPLFHDETPETFRLRLTIRVLRAVFGGQLPEELVATRIVSSWTFANREPANREPANQEQRPSKGWDGRRWEGHAPVFGACSILYAGESLSVTPCMLKSGKTCCWVATGVIIIFIPNLPYICNCGGRPQHNLKSVHINVSNPGMLSQVLTIEHKKYLWRYLEIYACLVAAYPAAGDRCLLRALFDMYLGPYGAFSFVTPADAKYPHQEGETCCVL
jgi:hypothetical protein